ncbi:phosphoribosylanthranilate isomerase [Saccharibacillus sp. JS10]|uniref:phosphoribosylanthranilate isomerase n=1 Tax=Saccharibacillus sp. JS10 TaxID=2950552 RepID=UPI00210B646F|nr:phosphoribosylanthranilate isomerase [Saccharibacillus sp. JS10]MCQ4085790.1 phosphoribosylanthranilate isomerase [Saccharibacillus sp. JS10]
MTVSSNQVPQIKICGIRTPEALLKAAQLNINYVGFVFAPSKRQVSPEQAATLIQALPQHSNLQTAGVFVNPTVSELKKVLTVAPLDILQLHGQESPELCQQIGDNFQRPIFKSVPIIGEDHSESHVDRAEKVAKAYEGVVQALLIDTHDPEYGGGSGRTFNWDVIPFYQKAAQKYGLQLFVAGGLNPDNVQELVGNYELDGIDVSSGVETDGHKDIAKMTTFVERAF